MRAAHNRHVWCSVARWRAWDNFFRVTAAIIRTEHGATIAMTAVHDRAFSRQLGGVRFVERGSENEVVHLAAGMAQKCAAARVPIGGQKTLIVCPDGVPATAESRAEILADHIRQVIEMDDGGVFGPDMGCGADVLDLLASEQVVGPHITGLSEARGGLDINARAFTARGAVHALDCFARLRGTHLRSATVQGFGMVGAPIALGLADRAIAVRAVSNRTGALISADGVDMPRLFALWRDVGDECLTSYASAGAADATFEADPDALFDVRADVFVPAARTTVLALTAEIPACRAEDPAVRSAEQFVERTGCKLVLEAANHPLTAAAEEYLERQGVVILPDVLVNIGGMVGCYAEWRYRELVRAGVVSLANLADRCHAFSQRSVEDNVRALLTSDESVRCAATTIVRRNRALMLSTEDSERQLFDLAGSQEFQRP
jgi:glutamate dehydrogenase/leucine dehydrogenase